MTFEDPMTRTLMTTAVMLLLAGCSGATVDQSDPAVVAREFVLRCQAGDYKAAYKLRGSQLSEVESYDDFVKEMTQTKILPFTSNTRLVVEIDGDTADVSIPDWGECGGIDMVMINGKWWVTR